MDDIRSGTCPSCRERGILVSRDMPILGGVEVIRYVCCSCGLVQDYAEDIRALLRKNPQMEMIGKEREEGPYR